MTRSQLHYQTLLARSQGLTRDLPAGDNEDLRWVANSATLIFGDHDAVLARTFLTIEQNERLIEWVPWCPVLRLIVAGDAVCSNTHIDLAETTTTSRREWIASLARLNDLHPLCRRRRP